MRPIAYDKMYPDSSMVVFYLKFSENPNVPNMEAIRKHLYEEGSVGKAELVKLIKDVT